MNKGRKAKILFGTNWKMNKTKEEAVSFAKELVPHLKDYAQFQFFVIPSFTNLSAVKEVVRGTNIYLGAQNMHWEDNGPYTGEISPIMLKEIGVDIIEIGHSERRQYFNETDYTVNRKVISGLRHGFTTLICIGEQAVEKEYDVSREVLARQLKIALHGVEPRQLQKVWLAYEPVWAIGENGVPAEPSYAGEMQTAIRDVLIGLYGRDVAEDVPILYGGSVNQENAIPFLSQPNVDGLFVGRAAWDVASFSKLAYDLNRFVQG